MPPLLGAQNPAQLPATLTSEIVGATPQVARKHMLPLRMGEEAARREIVKN